MPVYHVEIRKFPKSVTLFNQSGTQVGAIVLPWVQDRIIEVDGEKWAPYESALTILEGNEEIPLERRTMGRGWRVAQKEAVDVTERVLAEARQALQGDTAPTVKPPAPTPDPLAAGAQLAALLGNDAVRLLAAWRDVSSRADGQAPSESLAQAERELGSGPGR